MKCVFVTVGTTSFDDLIACVSAHDSLQVSGGGGQAKPSSPRLAHHSPLASLRPTLVTSPLPRGRKEPSRPDFRGRSPFAGSSPRPARPRLWLPRASASPASFPRRLLGPLLPVLSRTPSPHSPRLPPRSRVSLLPVSPPLWRGPASPRLIFAVALAVGASLLGAVRQPRPGSTRLGLAGLGRRAALAVPCRLFVFSGALPRVGGFHSRIREAERSC